MVVFKSRHGIDTASFGGGCLPSSCFFIHAHLQPRFDYHVCLLLPIGLYRRVQASSVAPRMRHDGPERESAQRVGSPIFRINTDCDRLRFFYAPIVYASQIQASLRTEERIYALPKIGLPHVLAFASRALTSWTLASWPLASRTPASFWS